MKKYLFVVFGAFLISIAGIVNAKAGYFTGPNNSLYVDVVGGSNWIEGTLSNDSAQHYKQIYVQLGGEGTWSDLVTPNTHSVTQRDYRKLFDKDYSKVVHCWKVNKNDALSCRS